MQCCRLFIVGVTDQLVHQHVAKERYLQTSQMLETEVGGPPKITLSSSF